MEEQGLEDIPPERDEGWLFPTLGGLILLAWLLLAFGSLKVVELWLR